MTSLFKQGNRVAVLGAGRSGESACNLLASKQLIPILLDSATTPGPLSCADRLKKSGIQSILGRAADCCEQDFDFVVLSPGIDPNSQVVRNLKSREMPIIAEIELAYHWSHRPIIGITGTNGKTTTTELVTQILNDNGKVAIACGNIGLPFCEVILEASPVDWLVIELSSFQLEAIRDFRPQVAAWLNFSPDHLDRYGDLSSYKNAKLRIFENQEPQDKAIVNLASKIPTPRSEIITFSAFEQGADFALEGDSILWRGEEVLPPSETNLKGKHNIENMMAAMGCAFAAGVNPNQMAASLRAFRPAPHRNEVIVEKAGRLFINDSKSTNIDSLQKSIMAQDRPVILIAGGKDKGFDFGALTALVAEKTKAVFLIGQMRYGIADLWTSPVCTPVDSLERAVTLAIEESLPGDVILFSPGTSSFDMFRDYADRGDQFKNFVQNLISNLK